MKKNPEPHVTKAGESLELIGPAPKNLKYTGGNIMFKSAYKWLTKIDTILAWAFIGFIFTFGILVAFWGIPGLLQFTP